MKPVLGFDAWVKDQELRKKKVKEKHTKAVSASAQRRKEVEIEGDALAKKYNLGKKS